MDKIIASTIGFDDSIYHEENTSIMPDIDVFSLLEFRIRNSRSHGKRQ